MQTLRADKYSPLLVSRSCLCVYLKSYAVRCVAPSTPYLCFQCIALCHGLVWPLSELGPIPNRGCVQFAVCGLESSDS